MSKKTVIISGSPKAPGKAASDFLAKITAEVFQEDGTQPRVISVRRTLTRKHTEQAFAEMAEADALVIIFPLYIFCLPGITMRFLQMYKAYLDVHPEAKKDMPVYAVVNCGFPEPYINLEAVQVIGRFASAIGASFRFGVMIGGGGMLNVPLRSAKKKLEEYRAAAREIKTDFAERNRNRKDHILIHSPAARKWYFLLGNIGWSMQARKFGNKKRDLYAKPYQPAENT